MGGKPGWTSPTVPKATRKPTREGEACFFRGGTELVTVSQVQVEVLRRLVELFGGSFYTHRTRAITTWHITGPRARGVIYTLYRFFSTGRRKQIRRALGIT